MTAGAAVSGSFSADLFAWPFQASAVPLARSENPTNVSVLRLVRDRPLDMVTMLKP